ncbi:hypothetical protein C8A01DRAFT_39751 [Parachaetomium inaequale]|uniref:Nephrocystin 3-like N-terminal domain-containing protein n=1 Tax=Parachaetomium inaequale TaxID=2588326 RepID=A0AAN6P8L8_9PEZI|nr:hypothetical protein C8A01DRAFT_39751 [Parachaetomium inaequale]
MAEAVAALSLAANVLQVTDFGIRFVSTAWNIWRSGPESIEAFAALQALSQDLKSVSVQLQTGQNAVQTDHLAASDKGIFEAARECSNAAQEILDRLDKLGLQSTPARKRDAARASFKLLWKSDDIKALQARFEGIRNQLTLNLAASLRGYAMQSLELQDNILQQLSKIQADNDDRKTQKDELPKKRKGFGSTVVGYLAFRRDQSESAALEADLRDALLGAVYGRKPPALDTVDDMESKLNVTSDRSCALRTQLLSSLYYDEMGDRVGTVSEAHDSTFRWIFDEPGQDRPWTDLGKWLQSDDQLYWITGKAGSGKSTLMKFISQPRTQGQASDEPAEARCLQHLRRWSDGQPLTVASFYFWAAGTKLQTSKAGLYRTLLCQILEEHTDVIPLVFPERWEALCLFNEDPKALAEDELQHSLTRALLLLAKTTKICLFVDGLDEFDGDHGNLIELLTRIIDGTSIKICVASRPWVVFEEALKNKPSLRLEDFTFNDIKEYVTSRFHGDSNFEQLWRREFEFADRLVERVVRKAAGVFLWVNLVVSSLLNGMKHGDRVSDLQRRLDSLPPDLEDLYERILDNLDPFYFEHAAQYFSLMGACQEPPSALLFSLADEDKPNFSFSSKPRSGGTRTCWKAKSM